MPWVKQQKVKQDFYLSAEDWTQLQQNDASFNGLMQIEHEHNRSNAGQVFQFGGHSHKRFAKAVARIGVYVASSYVNAWMHVASGIYWYPERLGVGVYRIGVRNSGTTNALYPFAFCPAETNGTALRDILSTFNNGSTNGNSFIGYELQLLEWDSVSSSWELADYDFGIVANSFV